MNPTIERDGCQTGLKVFSERGGIINNHPWRETDLCAKALAGRRRGAKCYKKLVVNPTLVTESQSVCWTEIEQVNMAPC